MLQSQAGQLGEMRLNGTLRNYVNDSREIHIVDTVTFRGFCIMSCSIQEYYLSMINSVLEAIPKYCVRITSPNLANLGDGDLLVNLETWVPTAVSLHFYDCNHKTLHCDSDS